MWTKLRKSYILKKKNLFLPFGVCYTVFPWPWFIIYMLTSFTGYADHIFHVISNFHIQRSKFGRKSDKFDGYSKNSWTLQCSWGSLFAIAGDPWHLVEPGQHQASRGVVVRIVKGKSRVLALLNPARYISSFLKMHYYTTICTYKLRPFFCCKIFQFSFFFLIAFYTIRNNVPNLGWAIWNKMSNLGGTIQSPCPWKS